MKAVRNSWLHTYIMLIAGLSLTGCMTDQNCPVCGSDETTCDVPGTADISPDATNPDTVAIDLVGDTALSDTAQDVLDDLNGGDADVIQDIPAGDAPIADAADVAADTFFTGTSRIKGRAYFTNMDDHSGFVIRLCSGEHDQWGNPNPPVATVVTGPDGEFEIDGLPAGYYELGIHHRTSTAGPRTWFPIDILDGETFLIDDQAYTATGSIGGTVIFPDNSSYHGGYAYLPGRDRYQSISVYDDEIFLMEYLPPGKYQICLGFVTDVGTCFEDVEVVGLETTNLGDIVVAPLDPVTGPGANVTGNAKMFGESDNAGIEVIYDPGPSQVIALTNAAGDYSFENVHPGEVEIRFNAPDGSGFERNSASMTYEFFAGTSEVLPSQTLVRGIGVWESGSFSGVPAEAEFSSDSRYLVFTIRGASSYTYGVDDQSLYSFNLETRELIWLADSVNEFQITPDSRNVIFSNNGGAQWLISVPIGGGSLQILTTRQSKHAMVSPDSQFVVFSTYPEYQTSGTFATDLDAGSTHHVCAGAPELVTGDSRTVFCKQNSNLEIVRLIDGSPVYASGDVNKYKLAPDLQTVFVCRNDETVDFVDVETGLISSLDDPVGMCNTILWLPDASGIVYVSPLDHLMMARIDGSAPITLDYGKTRPALVTPDSTRVIYARETLEDCLVDLLVIDIMGIGEPIVLFEDVATPVNDVVYVMGPDSGSFQIHDDSETLFAKINVSWATPELHRISLDGSRDINLQKVCYEGCRSWPKWVVDVGHGVAYVSRPSNQIQTVDISTGEVLYDPGQGFTIGQIASDFSGTMSRSTQLNALAWLSLPDLTPTFVRPLDEYPDVDWDYMLSDGLCSSDGTWCQFNSNFGGSGNFLMASKERRLFVLNTKNL